MFKQTLKIYLQTAVFNFAVFFQGIITLPILVRVSGLTVYGTYVLILAICSFLFGISSLGAGFRYRRAAASIANTRERLRHFEPQFFFQLGVIALASGVWYLLHNRTALFGTGPNHLASWYGPCLLIAANFFQSQAADYFRYTHRMLQFNLAVSAPPYIFVACVTLFAVMRIPLTVDTLVELQAGCIAMIAFPFMFRALREMGVPRLRAFWQGLAYDIRFGFPITLEYVMDYCLSTSDRYLIAAFISLTSVGRYQPGYQLAYLLFFVPKIAYVVLVPPLSKLTDAGKHDQARQLVDRFANVFLSVGVPFCFGALFTAPSILALLATAQVGEASRWVTPLVAVGGMFYGFSLLGSVAFFVLGRTSSILGASMAGAVVNVGLNLLLLPLYPSVTIPAFTSMVGFMTSAGVMWWLLRGRWMIDINLSQALRCVIASLCMCAFLWGIGFRPGQIAASGPLLLLGGIPTAMLIYFVCAILLGAYSRDDVVRLRAALLRRA